MVPIASIGRKGGTPGQFSFLKELLSAKTMNSIVCYAFNDRIQVFDADLNLRTQNLGRKGNKNGCLYSPCVFDFETSS